MDYYDTFQHEAWYWASWLLTAIPWVLPILVAIGLIVLQRVWRRTKKTLVEITKTKPKDVQIYDRTTALEYRKQYKKIKEQKLMQEIRSRNNDKEEDREKIEIQFAVESIRLFQSVEPHILFEIEKSTKLKHYASGDVLFGKDPKTGEYVNDLNWLTVVKGEVEIYTDVKKKKNGKVETTRELLSTVHKGQAVSSILSILESFLGIIDTDSTKSKTVATPRQRKKKVQTKWNENLSSLRESQEETPFLYDTEQTSSENTSEDEEFICAIAATDIVLAEIPLQIFADLQREYPASINRLIGSIIARLQRVTLLTMNKYFGLTHQLLHPDVKRRAAIKERTYRPYKLQAQSEEAQLRQDFDRAFNAFSKLLQLDKGGEAILNENLVIERHSPGSIVMAPKDPFVRVDVHIAACEPCLYYIIRGGALDVYLHDGTHLSSEDDEVRLINQDDHFSHRGIPGDIIGQLAVVSGDFYYRVVASSLKKKMRSDRPIVLGKIKKDTFDKMVANNYRTLNRVVYMIFLQLAPVVKLIDYAVDWVHQEGGDILREEGEQTNGMYVVLSGRLRAIRRDTKVHREKRKNTTFSLFSSVESSSRGTIVAEYGRGDSFGALEVLTETPFASNIVAIRDSEIAVVSSRLFKVIMHKFPEVVVRFSKIIADSWKKQMQMNENDDGNLHGGSRLSTIAVMGLTPNTPTAAFCSRLTTELQRIRSTTHLDRDYAMQSLGKKGVNVFAKRQAEVLIRWLGEMEEAHELIVYECENMLTPWTRRCLRQADRILMVANIDDTFEISEKEKYLIQNSISAQKELVLLHPKDKLYPVGSMNWLELRRGWCSACHHVMDLNPKDQQKRKRSTRRNSFRDKSGLDIKAFPRLMKRGAGSIWKRIRRDTLGYNTPLFGHAKPKDDVARLSRLLTGTAIGLVLGGGGARGCSHVGVIRALEENGIPIDMVGGTSIGSLIGGIYAREPDYINVLMRAKAVAKVMGNRYSLLLDLTYPRVSFLSGSGLNDVVRNTFGNTAIEDLRLNYFAISTNITDSKMMVHQEGLLWRYVRASMSLVGFVPPLCDKDGAYLVDGGYTNNLPADVMRKMGINTIIAVDVGGEVDTDYYNYGDSLNGFWLLWNKWNPFVKREKIPNLSDIQAQLAYVSSEALLEEVKNQKRCLYLRPPITQYGTLDFASFDEINEVGYQYAQKEIKEWKKKQNEFHLPVKEGKGRIHRRRSSAGASLSSLLMLD